MASNNNNAHRSSLSSSTAPRPSQTPASSSEELSSNEGHPLLKRVPDEDIEEWDEESQLESAPAATESSPDKVAEARRTYGGLAKHTQPQNTKGVFEVAWDVAASCLPAAPLLMPYAFNLTGLAIGLPLLFFLAALSWFSHVTLAVEGRYVGALSLNGLAASVFPRRFGGQGMSELLVDALILFVSLGRSLIVLAVSAHLVRCCYASCLTICDTKQPVFEHISKLGSQSTAILQHDLVLHCCRPRLRELSLFVTRSLSV